MNAIIHISREEFNEALFKRIRSLVNVLDDAEITISIHKDTRLHEAIDNVESGRNLTYFTLDQYEDFKKQLLNEP